MATHQQVTAALRTARLQAQRINAREYRPGYSVMQTRHVGRGVIGVLANSSDAATIEAHRAALVDAGLLVLPTPAAGCAVDAIFVR